jgi:hypothetical protein
LPDDLFPSGPESRYPPEKDIVSTFLPASGFNSDIVETPPPAQEDSNKTVISKII